MNSRPGSDLFRTPENVDRTLMAACAVVWLLVLGLFVAAGVALANLGQSRPQDADGGGTPWLLYTVIGISAAVIVAAVPLLLRARKTGTGTSSAAPAAARAGSPVRTAAPVAAAGRPPAAAPNAAALDRIWLRCGLSVLTAAGVAMCAVAIATHLMAVDSVVASWVLYAVAAVITAAMVVIPLYFLRELQAQVGPSA
ncbi:hypothetical protein MCHIJ_34330 [Mycolicibacterium chitae]|uniref:Conserved membrane protein of uncharacterized function n=1 Tax=Mycolicibacterium chitae TaxID=1792 RepID=A0A3S4RSB1_MYCCI|nr:DUF2561 family protein [Mycolicibacterium chitae]MCV7107033.1 DUF2561 family protein [Mycolicibacterium chitae]BBZ03996.1 hypothetical protein MCHIJ_34330 [Mycolicibacterium chitae]VEG47648.1 Conserved membrane protein of uncharacterised function [Mycolicibacterium chitae]